MNYKIYLNSLNTIHDNYGSFYDAVHEKFLTEIDKIDSLQNLNSFKGEAADSIKSYFSETHKDLIEKIMCLCEELFIAFNEPYYEKITGDIGEANDWALLTREELENKSNWIRDDLQRGRLGSGEGGNEDSIYQSLYKANQALPSDVTISSPLPDTSNLQNAFEQLIQFLDTLKNKLDEIETNGLSCVTEDISSFALLRNSIAETIANCRNSKLPISEYTSGTYASTLASEDLEYNFSRAMTYVDDNFDKLIESRNLVDAQLTNREIQAQKEQQRAWDTVGLLLEVASLALGVAAVVCTGGAAIPVILGAVGAVTSTMNIKKRWDKLNGSEDETLAGGTKVLGYGNEVASGTYSLGKGMQTGVGAKASKGVFGITMAATQYYAGEAGCNKEVRTGLSIGTSVSDITLDEYIDKLFPSDSQTYLEKTFNVSSRVSRIGKACNIGGTCVSILQDISDYWSEVCQEKIDSLQSDLEARQKGRGSTMYSQRVSAYT